MKYVIIVVAIALLLFLLIVNIVDLNRFVVREHVIVSDKISKKLRIVVLSDLHNKSYGKGNHKLLSAIRKCRPDIIICAGDIMTASPGEDFTSALSLMQELADSYPCFYGIGNHEYRAGLYPETYQTMYADYMGGLKESNICILDNKRALLQENNVTICGLQIGKEYYKRFTTRKMKENYLNEVIGTPSEKSFQILIAHNPEYFKEYVEWGADLILSGHIHGGLVRLPFIGGVASPAVKLFPKYDGGLFVKGKTRMIISRGLGTHTLPLRIFDPGEVISITLEPKESSLAKNEKN